MSDIDDRALLGLLAARLRAEPGFVSHDLARWRQIAAFEDPLKTLQASTLQALALCRTPRRDSHFGEDVRAIASHAAVDPARLARFFRLLDSAETLAAVAVTDETDTMLAAARDRAEAESTYVEPPPRGAAISAGAVPGWLTEVTEKFWAGEKSADVFPRDLDLHILLTLPVAIIEVPELRVRTVRAFLGANADAQMSSLPDRRLHACLLAYAGVGIIVVDAMDTAEERRVNLAHEIGHFLTDYEAVRSRVASHDPGLLDVMDGLRAASSTEEIAALITDLPLGVQTHLLERDPTGGHVARSTSRAEDRAEQVAWEILAPRAHVLARAPRSLSSDLTVLLRNDYGLSPPVADAYGRFLSRLATPRADNWLDGLEG